MGEKIGRLGANVNQQTLDPSSAHLSVPEVLLAVLLQAELVRRHVRRVGCGSCCCSGGGRRTGRNATAAHRR